MSLEFLFSIVPVDFCGFMGNFKVQEYIKYLKYCSRYNGCNQQMKQIFS